MSDVSNFVQLPMSGDLWRPPVINEDGSHVQREDTVSMQNMPMVAKMSPDVAAILMAELAAKGGPAAPVA